MAEKASEKRACADAEQQAAIDAILSGENVFLTGGAGCGKSFVIEEALRLLRKKRRNVVVCAPTGIAALNVGGTTVHRAFKLGLGVQGRGTRLRVREPISQADVIIIDEISMLRCDLFDAVSTIMRKARPRPQLVVVGDFSQLPPVVAGDDEAHLKDEYGMLYHGPFAFQGRRWQEWDFHPFILRDHHRQADPSFLDALTAIRKGDPSACQWISQHACDEYIEGAPYIASTNRVVDRINSRRLSELSGKAHTFKARTTGSFGSVHPVDETITLKRGARVVCCKNDPDDAFVNGSIGTVIGFPADGQVRVELDGGDTVTVEAMKWSALDYEEDEEGGLREVEKGTYTQIPLRLAWAMTIHKTQGLTLDSMNLDPHCFEKGQLYVALSRVRSVSDLYLTCPIDPTWLMVDPEVRAFTRQVWNISQSWDPEAHAYKTQWREPEKKLGTATSTQRSVRNKESRERSKVSQPKAFGAGRTRPASKAKARTPHSD